MSAALVEEARLAPLVVLKGRTDGTTDTSAESRIARERAAAVRDYLVEAGVDASRIRATYQPAGDHAADNTEADRSRDEPPRRDRGLPGGSRHRRRRRSAGRPGCAHCNLESPLKASTTWMPTLLPFADSHPPRVAPSSRQIAPRSPRTCSRRRSTFRANATSCAIRLPSSPTGRTRSPKSSPRPTSSAAAASSRSTPKASARPCSEGRSAEWQRGPQRPAATGAAPRPSARAR